MGRTGMQGRLSRLIADVPVKDALTTQDLTRHHRLAQFYAPVNWLDREVFGADGPTVCILFGLSK